MPLETLVEARSFDSIEAAPSGDADNRELDIRSFGTDMVASSLLACLDGMGMGTLLLVLSVCGGGMVICEFKMESILMAAA